MAANGPDGAEPRLQPADEALDPTASALLIRVRTQGKSFEDAPLVLTVDGVLYNAGWTTNVVSVPAGDAHRVVFTSRHWRHAMSEVLSVGTAPGMATTIHVATEQRKDYENWKSWHLRCTTGVQVPIDEVPLPRERWLQPMSQQQAAETRHGLLQRAQMHKLGYVLLLVLAVVVVVLLSQW
ncbi:MAG: hypothetical protein ACT4PP_12090 [Sporichthyaceae bacterium]